MAKASDNEFPSVLFAEQGADPSTPATGTWRAFFKSDGLYVIDDAGSVSGPFSSVSDVSAHAADTTSVHGIADTSLLLDTGDIGSTVQAFDADLSAIAGLTPANDDLVQRKAGAWTNRTPAQVKTDLALVKGDVGLGSVDNTSDLGKPISTATQAALDAKQDLDADLTALAAAVNSAVLAATTASFLTADETKLDGIEAGATADQTAAEILAALVTVDGAGSGLDADTVDGVQASALASSLAGSAATYGTDLVTNGAFTGSATGWTLGGGAAYGTDNVTVVNGSTVEQSVSVVSGYLYQVEWEASPDVNVSNVALGSVSSGLIESWKAKAVGLVAATTGSVTFRLTFGGSSTIDNVTVRPVVASAPASVVGGAEVRKTASTVAVGTDAQRSLTTGSNDTAIGVSAQLSLTTGTNDSAFGTNAQRSLTTGTSDSAFGTNAQLSLTTGTNDSAFGTNAQLSLTAGSNDTAFGVSAQRSLTTGGNDTAFGVEAQYAPAGNTANATTTGARQTAIGHQTGQSSSTQINDGTALGYRALYGATKATALGSEARADHSASVALGSDTTTTAADQVMVGTRDIEITGNATKGVVMRSPDGTRYRLTVANGGTLTITAA